MSTHAPAVKLIAAAVLGCGLWLSGAMFAPAGDGGWIAMLPPLAALAAAVAGAAILVFRFPPRDLASLLPLAAVFLPWTPGVDAGLIYAGPLLVLVWSAVLMLGWGDRLFAWVRGCGCANAPGRAMLAAFLISAAAAGLAAWRVQPMIPAGDEPHYLVAAQSLMHDGDLRIENNHQQRDYRTYAMGDLRPQYLVRGQNGEIYPIHAPGVSALAVPALAVGGYPAVAAFFILLMALAGALLWRVAWMATGDFAAAWFGWAAVATSCTWLFQSFLVFPDALGGGALVCGLWLVLRLDREPPAAPRTWTLVATGAALALLPWLHTRFAVLAAGLGLMIVLRLRRHGAGTVARFLIVPIAAALAWFAFFQVIYGTPSPLAPWGGAQESSLRWLPTGLAGILFDQQFGILPYAPAILAGVAGLAVAGGPQWRRSTRLQLLFLIVIPYVAASVTYTMWWGGHSVPARLLTAILPVLAPAAAAAWVSARQRPALRAAMIAALAWGIFATMTLAFVEQGGKAWNVRQRQASLWFEWLTPLINWTEALPAFFRADPSLGRESLPLGAFYVLTVIWLAAVAAAIAAASLVARVTRLRPSAVTATILFLALPAATIVALRAGSADGLARERARTAMLARISSSGGIALDLGSRRRLAHPEAVSRLRMTSAGEDVYRPGQMAAGRYRLSIEPAGAPAAIFIARGAAPVARITDAPVDLFMPVAVNALEVRGAGGRRVTIEPVEIPPMRWRQRALRALRYGRAVVYFLDDRAYAEADAFWVGGARYTNVVIQGDPGVTSIELEIQNAPVENAILVTGAELPERTPLQPQETVVVPVGLDERGTARLQIESASGFIPANLDLQSRDFRYLGVSVRVR